MSRDDELVRLSRRMSLALRHEPARFGLSLDPEGYTPLSDLAAALEVDAGTIREVIARVEADKQRFSIVNEDVRANYGHSLGERIQQDAAPPPAQLLHGTHGSALARILAEGLKPMSRQYVHLTGNAELARRVGARRGSAVLLHVDAHTAHQDGIRFYRANEAFWLADFVPASYLSLVP